MLASNQTEVRNAEAIRLRLQFIENEENLCHQRLDLLSNVSRRLKLDRTELSSMKLDENERLKQPLISPKDMIKVSMLRTESTERELLFTPVAPFRI